MRKNIYILAFLAITLLFACESAFESGDGEKQIRSIVRKDTIIVTDTLIEYEEKIVEVVVIEYETIRDTIYDTIWIGKEYPLDLQLTNEPNFYEEITYSLDSAGERVETSIVLDGQETELVVENARLDVINGIRTLDIMFFFNSIMLPDESLPFVFYSLFLNLQDLEIEKEIPLNSVRREEFVITYLSPFENIFPEDTGEAENNVVLYIDQLNSTNYLVRITGEFEYIKIEESNFPFITGTSSWELEFELSAN